MGCPHCGSLDVHRSHTSYGLDRIGFHRCRCRACNGLFWLRSAQLEAVRVRRREAEAQQAPGTAPGESRPTPGPDVPAPAPDEPTAAQAPRPVADLSALDDELSRRRADTPPH
jgi:hypothetical protein